MGKKKGRKSLIGMAVCVALVTGLAGCGEKEAEVSTQEEEISVAVAAGTPRVGTLTVSGTFIGTVSPQEQVSIIPLVSGEVTEVNFEVGDYVEAGSVLVRIDDEAARLQLESAQLSKEGAELSAQRTLGSAQVMSNLSMESNINSIQYQIDMAKKQYDAAGDSVADAYEAKEDMQDALNKINESIDKMEDGYNGMKKMAASAKNLVRQNERTGIWEWALPEEPNWEEEYHTTPTGVLPGGGGGTGPADPDTSGDPAGRKPDDGTMDDTMSGGTIDMTESGSPEGAGGSAGSGGAGNTGDSAGSGSNGAGSTGGSAGSGGAGNVSGGTGGSPDGSSSDRTDGVSEGNTSAQPSPDPTDRNPSTSSDALKDRPGSTGAGFGQIGETEGAEPSAKGSRTVERLAASGKRETTVLSMEEIRCHTKPWEDGAAQPLRMAGGYEFLRVSEVGGTPDTDPDDKKPYAEYVRDKAIFDATYKATSEAVDKLKAAGYSPADIGEGRMDSSVANYAAQISSLKSQASTLESNVKSMDSNISSAETSRSTTADSIDFYEDNLKNAQIQYGIQNGQAYQDTAAALANQIASTDVGIASARMQLENYVLTAPISGQIEQKNVDEYGMVSAGNPVYVISNKDTMTVTFYVSEAVRNQLVPGETVTLERGGQTWTAAVTQTGQSVDARTGLFEIKAMVEGSDLANGVTVKIYADTAKEPDALLIPYDAVYYQGETAYVYCVEDGILVKTPVETGLYDEDTIAITGGLSKDSVVVHTWSSQLADGIKVRMVEEGTD